MNVKEYLTSKKYGSLRYKLSYFFHSKIPFLSPGWNEYRNPWYHWWKARKYFKRPKAHFLFRKNFWTFGLPIRRDYYSPVIDIGFHALGWKDKWDSPRHEWDPMICITFFRTWHLLWIFNWATKHKKDSITGSMATWEAILDYTRYDKSLSYVVDNHIWSYDRDGEKVYISIVSNMTREGLNKYSDESKHTEKDTEIQRLEAGESFITSEPGNSMLPLYKSNEKHLVTPIRWQECNVGDVVFCKVRGACVTHKVYAIDSNKGCLIGNNKGHMNGWTKNVYGLAHKI